MRMRSRASGPASNEEVEILSTEEQQRVIDELKTEASRQSGFFRNVFYVIFMGVAIAFLICLGYSFVQPWGLLHQQHFKDKIPHAAFLLYYALSAYCFIVAGLLVKVCFVFSIHVVTVASLSLLLPGSNALNVDTNKPLQWLWSWLDNFLGLESCFSQTFGHQPYSFLVADCGFGGSSIGAIR